MANGDSIQAGHITTAYSTTDLVAEQERKPFGTKAFVGDVIFRVGPTNNATNGLMPDTTLDGVQGAGNQGGSGLVGRGGFMLATNFRASARLVLAVVPIHFRRSQIRPGLVSKASRANRKTELVRGGTAPRIMGSWDSATLRTRAACSVSTPNNRARDTACSDAATPATAPGLKRNPVTASGSGDIAD